MGCQNELFIALRRNLDVSKAQSMEQTIAEIIQNDTTNTKSTLHMRMQVLSRMFFALVNSHSKFSTAPVKQYFAVKAGINGLLDVARKTYSETIEGTTALQTQLSCAFLFRMFHRGTLWLRYSRAACITAARARPPPAETRLFWYACTVLNYSAACPVSL